MISHRSNRLKVIDNPSVEQLQNGRFRLSFNMTALNPRNDWYYENRDRLFADFGTLASAEMQVDGIHPRNKETYPDMRLVSVKSEGQGVLQFIYETLTNSFVQTKDDTVDFEVNGLRRVTRESVAKAGTDYDKVVGTSSIQHTFNSVLKTLYLSSFAVDNTDSSTGLKEVYIEAGTLQEDTRPGPVPGTTQVNRTSVGVASTPAGELTSFSDSNKQGLTTFSRSTIQGTIEGVKQQYIDVVEVQTPGVVTPTTINVSQDGIGGTVAITNVVPARTKKIPANVEVRITETPTNTGNVAFDLSNVSCSTMSVSTSTSKSFGTPVVLGETAQIVQTPFNTNFSPSARIQTFPGHYFTGSEVTGTVNYQSSFAPDGEGGASEAFSSSVTRIIPSGTSSAPGPTEGYYTTGVLKRSSRPILTTLSDTGSNPTIKTYYEEITWSV